MASTLNTNVNRLILTREEVEKQQAMAAQQQAMMQQMAMQEAANLQEDGSEMGGRESNIISPRPNGA